MAKKTLTEAFDVKPKETPKNGLKDYVTNTSILEAIDTNYENLKVTISEYDAELKLVAENAANKKIIVANNTFKFLEKLSMQVIII